MVTPLFEPSGEKSMRMLATIAALPCGVFRKSCKESREDGNIRHVGRLREKTRSMRNRMHGILKVALTVLVALLLSSYLYSSRLAATTTPVNEITRLVDEIDSINTKIVEIDRNYGALIASLSEFNSQADEAAALRRKAERNLEAKKKRLNRRLVSRYKSGNNSWLTVLLSYRDLLDFLDKIDLCERVTKKDAEAFRAVKAARETIREQENSIVEKRRMLRSKCSWAIEQKNYLGKKLDECMNKLASADPVLAKVMAQPQTELSRRINAYLAKRRSPLTGYGIVFVQAEQRTGVSARLLAGLAEAESSCATAGMYSRTNHNAWGMKGPQPQIAGGIPANYGYCTWANWEIAIQQAADFVLHYWGPAQTAGQLPGYCETGGPGSDWERRIETTRSKI
jgi:peptidoglycan hydrolase CwlO-like protein